ncbi:MAG TPA: SGNH/GDSL hydrolase family protein, partial [Leptolyngbyaceae cyanobacterium]
MTLKIMPLGDSITYGVVNSGYTESGGYRTELWNLFKADNFNTDFVGSISSGPSDIDKNNEGHRGWRIDQIASSVNQWLDSYQPDVILLTIGTNDILQNYDLANAPNRLNNLIDTIANKLPNTELLVSSILPITRNSTQQQQAIDFNSYIPGIVNSQVSQGKKVSFVDMFSKVNGADLADNVHPTINGYTKIANAWYEALKPLTGIENTIRIQAEEMSLTNYLVESGNDSALQRKVISLYGSGSSTGTASLYFSGNSGQYDVVVGYYDENDGQSNLKVNIAGEQVDAWTLNRNLGSGGASNQTKLRRTVATGIYLNQGTFFEIEGTANQGEFARVDYIEFIPNQTISTVNLAAQNITQETATSYTFNVTYTDSDGVDITSLDNQDVRVTGPNNFSQLATLVSINESNNGSPRTATYKINAPDGSWDATENGNYTVALQNNQVSDTKGNYFTGGNLGNFQVNVPLSLTNIRIEAENMQRTGYLLETNSAASNNQLVSLYQSSATSGKINTTFNGTSGIYDVVLRYFDESDGNSVLTTRIGGTQIDRRTLNQYLGNNSPISQT